MAPWEVECSEEAWSAFSDWWETPWEAAERFESHFLDELLGSFTDGGITTILPAITPLDQRLGGSNVAVRVFAHPEAIKLASNVGAITATSANESGIAPECNTEEAAKKLGIQDFVPGTCPNGLGSTYIRLEEDGVEERGWRLTVMREGVVPQADVMKCVAAPRRAPVRRMHNLKTDWAVVRRAWAFGFTRPRGARGSTSSFSRAGRHLLLLLLLSPDRMRQS